MKFVINDYFFYKIVCLTEDVDLSYVGSTCNWRSRKNNHKSDCNNPNSKKYNNKKYQMMRDNGGWDNFKMIEIGFREQLTLRQAEAIEEDYRVELRANMNTYKCNSGCETRQEYNANYQQENREQLLEYQANYRLENKEKISEYKANYRLENKEKISEHSTNYRLKNRDHLNAKHDCEICGGNFITKNKSVHLKSKKHEKAVNDAASSSSSTED